MVAFRTSLRQQSASLIVGVVGPLPAGLEAAGGLSALGAGAEAHLHQVQSAGWGHGNLAALRATKGLAGGGAWVWWAL